MRPRRRNVDERLRSMERELLEAPTNVVGAERVWRAFARSGEDTRAFMERLQDAVYRRAPKGPAKWIKRSIALDVSPQESFTIGKLINRKSRPEILPREDRDLDQWDALAMDKIAEIMGRKVEKGGYVTDVLFVDRGDPSLPTVIWEESGSNIAESPGAFYVMPMGDFVPSDYEDCRNCGDSFREEDLTEGYCEICLEEMTPCDECDQISSNDDMTFYNNRYLCESCLDAVAERCQACGDLLEEADVFRDSSDDAYCERHLPDEPVGEDPGE